MGGTVTFTFTVQVTASSGSKITNTAYADWNKQVIQADRSTDTITIQTSVS